MAMFGANYQAALQCYQLTYTSKNKTELKTIMNQDKDGDDTEDDDEVNDDEDGDEGDEDDD